MPKAFCTVLYTQMMFIVFSARDTSQKLGEDFAEHLCNPRLKINVMFLFSLVNITLTALLLAKTKDETHTPT